MSSVQFDKCDCGQLEWRWNDKGFFDTIVLRVLFLSLSLQSCPFKRLSIPVWVQIERGWSFPLLQAKSPKGWSPLTNVNWNMKKIHFFVKRGVLCRRGSTHDVQQGNPSPLPPKKPLKGFPTYQFTIFTNPIEHIWRVILSRLSSALLKLYC